MYNACFIVIRLPTAHALYHSSSADDRIERIDLECDEFCNMLCYLHFQHGLRNVVVKLVVLSSTLTLLCCFAVISNRMAIALSVSLPNGVLCQ